MQCTATPAAARVGVTYSREYTLLAYYIQYWPRLQPLLAQAATTTTTTTTKAYYTTATTTTTTTTTATTNTTTTATTATTTASACSPCLRRLPDRKSERIV